MIAGLWRAWSGLWGVLGAALVAGAAGLFAAGAFDGPRLAAASRALRGVPAPAVAVAAPPSEDESVRRQHELSLAARRAELDRLEARVSAGLARLDAGRPRAVPVAAPAEPSGSSGAVLARLDPAAIVDVLRGGDDASFARALRGLRPSLAAEVLEALRSDPALESEFRRAGAGGRTRSERILEEFRKGS